MILQSGIVIGYAAQTEEKKPPFGGFFSYRL
jgi:hypothetical protein